MPALSDRRRLVAAAFAASLAGGWIRPAHAQPADPLANRFGGPFALTDHENRRRSERDFHGVFPLIYFGYTYCPDVCPTTLVTMAQAVNDLAQAGALVQPLFITVDPARDTPALLKPYVSSFHERLIGLTGSEADIAAVTRAWRVHRVKVLRAPHDDAAYTVDHGALVYLMGRHGQFLTLFPHGTTAERMTRVMRDYIRA
ncbi:MAG: SCO family protein [Beijerinckiaceae bacterium]